MIKTNEKKSVVIDISAADQTEFFNSIYVTATGTLKYEDAVGTVITIATNIPVGKFEVSGRKIYRVGTSLAGVLLQHV